MLHRLAALGLLLALAGPVRAADTVDAAQLMKDVQVLSADDMQGRLIGSPGGAKARAYVEDRLKGLGLAVSEQAFDATLRDGSKAQGVNIIARIDGAGPTMVVSAHYDHLGVRGGQIYNGADDNASGVGAVLAAAAALKASPPKHPVLLVLFDGEEGGLRGAKAFVAAPPIPLAEIGLNINFDMLSKNAKGELYVSGGSTQPAVKTVLEAVARTAPVTLLLGHDTDAKGKSENWTNQSDQGAFAAAKVPWVYFGVEDHPEYHKPTDDFATIPQVFYLHATETVVAAVRAFDADLDGVAAGRGKP
jgi:Zn-dependent M28 family amino/carboxypeptidase